MTRKHTQRARRGFTLIEVGISLGILVVLLIAVGRVVLAGSRAYRIGSARDAVVMKARRALDRIADELAMAGIGNMNPVPNFPNHCSSLDVSTPIGLVDGVVQFGNVTRILLRADPSDPPNNADDDGDGFVDEGLVECTKNVGLGSQRTVVLCEDVTRFREGEVGGNGVDDNGDGLADERGLSFVLNTERLTISLTVQGRDADGRVLRQTVDTSIKIRN